MRGLTVCSSPSSSTNMITLPITPFVAPSGQSAPVVILAAMSQRMVLFPRPPSPAVIETVPSAMRFIHSHSTGLAITLERRSDLEARHRLFNTIRRLILALIAQSEKCRTWAQAFVLRQGES